MVLITGSAGRRDRTGRAGRAGLAGPCGFGCMVQLRRMLEDSMASVVADGFGISGRSGLFRPARPDHLVQAVWPSVLVLADAPGRVLALRISRFYYISRVPITLLRQVRRLVREPDPRHPRPSHARVRATARRRHAQPSPTGPPGRDSAAWGGTGERERRKRSEE